MQPSLLEEVASVPNPYPIRSEIEYPEVWRLCEQARDLAWNPLSIDFSDLREADLPAEERERAGRNRALACEWGLGATHPDNEIASIKRALEQIRSDIAPYGVVIPEVPEVDLAAAMH
jgi:hypothetical protein